jgi:hypothetical protein
MTNMKSSKYANLFINKTFNNFLWRNVIYDSNYNDSFIYDLNRFVNKITFAHELIDIFNDSIMIEKYEIMLVINHINDKNRKMFFENIAYVSFIDVILMFITRFKNKTLYETCTRKFWWTNQSTRWFATLKKSMTCFFWNIDQSKSSSMQFSLTRRF